MTGNCWLDGDSYWAMIRMLVAAGLIDEWDSD